MERITDGGYYDLSHKLEPGMVDKDFISTLINISKIRSAKVIMALVDYYVSGDRRNVICEKYNVNPGYFSLKVREIQHLNVQIYRLLPYYIDIIKS